jgi:hypothetical protein
MTTYKQYRLAKRNGEIVQQTRQVSTTTKNKWYKPWEYTCEYEYSEWEDLPFINLPEWEMDDKGYELGDLNNPDFKEIQSRHHALWEKE